MALKLQLCGLQACTACSYWAFNPEVFPTPFPQGCLVSSCLPDYTHVWDCPNPSAGPCTWPCASFEVYTSPLLNHVKVHPLAPFPPMCRQLYSACFHLQYYSCNSIFYNGKKCWKIISQRSSETRTQKN